ncbi:hypothetical protein [Sinanaerobacter sp. ZZT-01]|uniref:hypothetical protein n=1 Tax=Sinanaerobacter sp. ZZT-01 TaxID=3111540 RepID=UPI002D78E821|nr:hypothetical protein [Sinanaerobacter sp. ZZT-01]WRR92091.1 hypothetical protein U5921_08385 [Sinanaerobacter sp. ZZT-01]
MCWEEKLNMLYGKDNLKAYAVLQELEILSEKEDALYPYFEQFLEMLQSEKYMIRMRGLRLLCKQAKWDKKNKIDENINEILSTLEDKKPTAVRQALKALEDIVVCKPGLHRRIKEKAEAVNYMAYKDTMHHLIKKDIQRLREIMEHV